MKQTQLFYRVRFTADVLEQAFDLYANILGAAKVEGRERRDHLTGVVAYREFMTVEKGPTEWTYDDSAEFDAELRRGFSKATIHFRREVDGSPYGERQFGVDVSMYPNLSHVEIYGDNRQDIVKLMAHFEKSAPDCTLPPEPEPEPEPVAIPEPVEPPRVFVGHGRDPLWKDLKLHLSDHHGYKVEAYETGSRSGHTIRDVLDTMLDRSTFACLILTAEDEQPDGRFRARQNVVHEAGLFQGRLGFPRVAVLVETGVELFSNIDGIQYIQFSKGNIRETYGDVLAALEREFPRTR